MARRVLRALLRDVAFFGFAAERCAATVALSFGNAAAAVSTSSVTPASAVSRALFRAVVATAIDELSAKVGGKAAAAKPAAAAPAEKVAAKRVVGKVAAKRVVG